MNALSAGQEAPPTVFEVSRCCCTNSLHEPQEKQRQTQVSRFALDWVSENLLLTQKNQSPRMKLKYVGFGAGCLEFDISYWLMLRNRATETEFSRKNSVSLHALHSLFICARLFSNNYCPGMD